MMACNRPTKLAETAYFKKIIFHTMIVLRGALDNDDEHNYGDTIKQDF